MDEHSHSTVGSSLLCRPSSLGFEFQCYLGLSCFIQSPKPYILGVTGVVAKQKWPVHPSTICIETSCVTSLSANNSCSSFHLQIMWQSLLKECVNHQLYVGNKIIYDVSLVSQFICFIGAYFFSVLLA